MTSRRQQHSGIKTSWVLGATAMSVANTQAAVVYFDTTGKDLTVAGVENTTYEETLDFYYDSATQEIGIGGTYGNGGNRGIQIMAKGISGKGSDLYVNARGTINSGGNFYFTSAVEGGGQNPFTVGTIIGKGSNFPTSDQGGGFGLYGGIDCYVGIRVWAGDIDGEYNYGWAKLTTSPDKLSVTLKELAFETDINTPITITSSAVPEPGNIVSLAALLSSVALIRTRRKAAATA